MPLLLVRNDITHMKVDAIVNATNESMLDEGGVGGAIHAAAGPQLAEECKKLRRCWMGQAKITLGYNLPCKYVIHTVGPVYRGGHYGEEILLRQCYRNSLALAHKAKAETLAIPLISTGARGYPQDEAIRIAEEEIRRFLDTHDMTVYLVFFSWKAFSAGMRRFPDIARFIDDAYVLAHTDARRERHWEQAQQQRMEESQIRFALDDMPRYSLNDDFSASMRSQKQAARASEKPKETDLETMIAQRDEGFSATLLFLIDSKGMTDAQCYKKANVDRKLFSKIRSDKHYRPSKSTVMAFALALELTLEETEALLKRAGYAMSHAFVQDIIVEYFITHEQYDIFAVNEALFAFDQPLLGGR